MTDTDASNMLLQPFSTLDEPVAETIMRDVRAVATKLKIVMLPLDKRSLTPFGYMGLSQGEQQQQQGQEGQQQPQQTPPASQSAEQQELGANQKKIIDELKNWDLW